MIKIVKTTKTILIVLCVATFVLVRNGIHVRTVQLR